jgi:N-acetylmuramoyl-L-alanine amidase
MLFLAAMEIRDRPSPNHGPRREPGRIDMLILHYTGMPSAAAALERLCDPAAEVSAHYLVDEDGAVWRLVDESRRAWHAGAAVWAGERDINSRSLGIELVNPGHEHGYRRFAELQIAALEELCRGILERHPIPPDRVLGHSDVAPQRKADPGELFPWQRLAAAGIGRWPEAAEGGTRAPLDVAETQRALGRIGYEIAPTGTLDAETRAVLVAFQRHYRPEGCDGMLDRETMGRVLALDEILRQR